MKKAMRNIPVLLVACSVLCSLNARVMVVLSYRELFDRSDVVAIATPTAQTKDTSESSFLPNIVRVASIGVETPFKVSVILKGDPALERFVLHHYREAVAERILSGPSLLHFDPSNAANRQSYLMFLIRETDGRYAPTGGQTDPGFNSVVAVPLDRRALQNH